MTLGLAPLLAPIDLDALVAAILAAGGFTPITAGESRVDKFKETVAALSRSGGARTIVAKLYEDPNAKV